MVSWMRKSEFQLRMEREVEAEKYKRVIGGPSMSMMAYKDKLRRSNDEMTRMWLILNNDRKRLQEEVDYCNRRRWFKKAAELEKKLTLVESEQAELDRAIRDTNDVINRLNY